MDKLSLSDRELIERFRSRRLRRECFFESNMKQQRGDSE